MTCKACGKESANNLTECPFCHSTDRAPSSSPAWYKRPIKIGKNQFPLWSLLVGGFVLLSLIGMITPGSHSPTTTAGNGSTPAGTSEQSPHDPASNDSMTTAGNGDTPAGTSEQSPFELKTGTGVWTNEAEVAQDQEAAKNDPDMYVPPLKETTYPTYELVALRSVKLLHTYVNRQVPECEKAVNRNMQAGDTIGIAVRCGDTVVQIIADTDQGIWSWNVR
jgi:hypothetical protein